MARAAACRFVLAVTVGRICGFRRNHCCECLSTVGKRAINAGYWQSAKKGVAIPGVAARPGVARRECGCEARRECGCEARRECGCYVTTAVMCPWQQHVVKRARAR